jgi:hypothetical protein
MPEEVWMVEIELLHGLWFFPNSFDSPLTKWPPESPPSSEVLTGEESLSIT